MRSTFLAVLVDPHGAVSTKDAVMVATGSLQKEGYEPWTEPVPDQYQTRPREILNIDIATSSGFVLFRPEPTTWAPHWCLNLIKKSKYQAVVLYMGPELDTIPGIGTRARGGDKDGPVFKIYANDEPWLKVGNCDDPEVAYPVPTLVPERMNVVLEKLSPCLGPINEIFKASVRSAFARNDLRPETLLRALGLTEEFPYPDKSLCFIRTDSPLYRNASPSRTGGGI